jgi:hypothetical protein
MKRRYAFWDRGVAAEGYPAVGHDLFETDLDAKSCEMDSKVFLSVTNTQDMASGRLGQRYLGRILSV